MRILVTGAKGFVGKNLVASLYNLKENCGFTERLLNCLKESGNTCPVMLASSVQASLEGRYKGSLYGESKLAGEELFFRHGRETGAQAEL